MLPSSSLHFFSFVPPRAAAERFEKESWNCTVISAQEMDKRRVLLGKARDLTDSRLHLGCLVRQELGFVVSRRNHTE